MLICIQDCGVIVLFFSGCKVTHSKTVDIVKISDEILVLKKIDYKKSTETGICLQQEVYLRGCLATLKRREVLYTSASWLKLTLPNSLWPIFERQTSTASLMIYEYPKTGKHLLERVNLPNSVQAKALSHIFLLCYFAFCVSTSISSIA